MTTNTSSTSENVLIIDDDPVIRLLAREALEQAGFSVRDTGDSSEAFSLFGECRPDIVLLDVIMPGVDGFTLCQEIRNHAEGADIPILMMTGLDDLVSINRAYDAGATDFITKPIHWPLLAHRVRYMIRGSKTTQELANSRQRYQQLFAANPHPMFVYDLETLRFLMVNDAAVAHYGYSEEEFLAMTVKDIRPPEDVPDLLANVAAVTEGLDDAGIWRHLLKDGRLIEVAITSHTLDFGGRRAEVVLAHDVTAQRRAEERMRLYAAALASTRDAVVITDLEPRILAVNPAFTEVTGYSEAEVLGENPRILNSGRHDRAFFQAMWKSLLQSGHWAGEIWNRRKSGEAYPEWLTLSTVCNERDEPTHYVAVITDLTQLRNSEAKLHRLAHYDPLTDLPNRLLLMERLQHTLMRAEREEQQVGVLVIDVDQFKTVNNSFGHTVGDELLFAIVQRLKGRVRRQDTLARLSGDQFVLLLENLEDHAQAEIVAHELQEALEAPFVLADECQVYVRASIGISIYPQNGTTPEELLRGADAAVHQAKERGGKQFCYYTSELNTQARATLELESALRQALAQEEFVLHYQPKVDLRSGRIVGVEALLRWERSDYGIVPPLQFIPLAEKTGLIIPIGAWVIEEACRQMHAWRDAGLGEIKVAVNVSARQFRSDELEALVAKALEKHAVQSHQLMLELTESILMENPEDAIARMAVLRRSGVRFSLDDFGTGYSSLGYLSRLPIDELKIDRSFITGIVTDPSAATIATSIIALARRMRLQVVAEGVETEAQLGYLRQNGCDMIQGYRFCEAVPAARFADLLRQGEALPAPAEMSDAPTLLIVDDEPHILSALRRLLLEEDYRVLTAGSACEGLELLAQYAVQVIITDQRMPGMSGTEFLGRVKVLHPHTVRLVLSGYADLPTVTEAVNEGALYKFLAKPWDDEHLREQIRDAFVFYEMNIKPCQLLSPGF